MLFIRNAIGNNQIILDTCLKINFIDTATEYI